MSLTMVLGLAAATLTTASFVPQAWRIIRTQDTQAISLTMYGMFTLGIIFWLIYGIALGEWPIIIANVVTLLLAGTILYLKLLHDYFRKSRSNLRE